MFRPFVQDSALAQHLLPGSRITHLDDYELDASAVVGGASAPAGTASTVALWARHLSSVPKATDGPDYEHLGWCLDEALFPSSSSSEVAPCCAPSEASFVNGSSPSGICFRTNSLAPEHGGRGPRRQGEACLDPILLELDSEARPVPRCVDAESCSTRASGEGGGGRTGEGDKVCARIAAEADVVRIRVVGTDESGSWRVRTVWRQGPRQGVLHQGEQPGSPFPKPSPPSCFSHRCTARHPS